MKIGDYIKILSGFAFDSSLFNECNTGMPLVRIRDIGKSSSETFYSGKYSEEFLIDNGDFLIGMDGEFRLAEWKGGKALLNQRVCKITTDNHRIYPKYLYFVLPRELKKIEDSTSFVTVKHLSVNKIKEIQIPLPPLETQKKIAAILDAADEYRQKTKTLIEKYDQLAQSLFLEMFGDPVKNEKGWEKSSIGTFCEKIQIGPFGSQLHQSDYIETGISLINPVNIIDNEIRLENIVFISKELYDTMPQYHLKKNDIIMARRGDLSKVGLIRSNNDLMFCGTGSLFIRFNGGVNVYFVHKILSDPSTTNYLNYNSRGITMPNVNKEIISNIPIIKPPILLQNQFAERIQLIESQKQQAQTTLQKAEELFNSLLQRAFKGELV